MYYGTTRAPPMWGLNQWFTHGRGHCVIVSAQCMHRRWTLYYVSGRAQGKTLSPALLFQCQGEPKVRPCRRHSYCMCQGEPKVRPCRRHFYFMCQGEPKVRPCRRHLFPARLMYIACQGEPKVRPCRRHFYFNY